MRESLIIGSGFTAHFLAFYREKKFQSAPLLLRRSDEKLNVLDGQTLDGEFGSLCNWGGQIFLDYSHPIFETYKKDFILGLLIDFIEATSESGQFEISFDKLGIFVQLEKNWKPSSIQLDKMICNVSQFNPSTKIVAFDDGSKESFQSIDICTGSHSYAILESGSIIFRTPFETEVFDKQLFFENLQSATDQNRSLVQVRDTWVGSFMLKPGIPDFLPARSITKLMHYRNGIMDFGDLTISDITAGLHFLTQKLVSGAGYKGKITTIAPKLFDDPE